MSLATGTRLGSYEIVALLGAGGMGEVYRARDLTLGREVAIKILPDQFAADAVRLARFEREARTLAALNHPHIAQIYGLENTGSSSALVMELVDGEDLSQRIAQGPLPLAEALPIARQIAEAVEAAHELGIIHRDLKPANIKVRRDGTVKVLDFGLAKATDDGGTAASSGATITSPAISMPGVILGTAAYMSPEQAVGKPVDKRADVWAFGCVLHEMLTGRKAFSGPTASDTITAILARDPDWTQLPPSAPAHVRRLLARCLTKDARLRLRDIGDARLELDEPRDGIDAPASRRTARFGPRLAWTVAAVALAIAAWALVGPTRLGGGAPVAARLTFAIPPPPGVSWGSSPVDPSPAASPDGTMVAFAGVGPNGRRLWIHDIRTGSATALEGTQDATEPSWSPDSSGLVYCARGKLKTFNLSGRASAEIDAPGCGSTVSWSDQGEFLYWVGADGLWRVTTNGPRQRVTTVDPARETAHAYPRWLPGGRAFVFLVRSLDANLSGIYLGGIDGATTRLVADNTAPAFTQDPEGTDWLLFVRGATLVSQRLDTAARSVIGEPMVLGERVAIGITVRDGAYAVAPSLLVYRSEGGFPRSSLTWFDRQGRNLGVVESNLAFGQLSLSPDGSTLASERYNLDTNQMELWLTDLARKVPRPLRVMPYGVGNPLWAPDGARLIFLSTETGSFVPFELTLAGSVRPLLRSQKLFTFPSDWSADGRWILGISPDGLSAAPADGSADPRPLVSGGVEGRLSPDGRWLAYRSGESGRAEIYLQRFPDGSQRTRVSNTGGVKPSWRGDGAELFYRAGRLMMAVDVRAGDRLELGTPRALFSATVVPGFDGIPFYDYVVTKDGQRFLVETAVRDDVAPLTAVVNWTTAAATRQ